MKYLLLFTLIFTPISTFAMMDHSHHHSTSLSTKEYPHTHHKMNKEMAINLTGDPDIDFLRGMIPHHAGAVDMAFVVLAHGKDSRVRNVARRIIDAQVNEITQMKTWLRRLSLVG